MCCLQVSEEPLIHLDSPVQRYDGCDLYECVVCRCLESHWFTWIAQSNDMMAVTHMKCVVSRCLESHWFTWMAQSSDVMMAVTHINALCAGVWRATGSPGWPSPTTCPWMSRRMRLSRGLNCRCMPPATLSAPSSMTGSRDT